MTEQRSRNASLQQPSRRVFLKLSSLAGASLGGIAATNRPLPAKPMPRTGEADRRQIRIAGYRYDRVEAITDGRVDLEGCDVRFEVSKIGDMNRHVFSGPGTRDVTEIGLLPYILAFANEGFRDYALLPVFPLRQFRHKSVFVRNDRKIESPADLRGKRIATPGYSSTSLTWIRGILQHEYGVRPDQVEWVVSAKDSTSAASGGPSKQENVLPKGISVRSGPRGKDESDLLADGDVDALFHAAEPRVYIEGHPRVERLFPDYRKTERAYFAKTGIFPIMHAVAIRRDLATSSPGLTRAVFDAYVQAKRYTYQYLNESAWFASSLPWIGQEVEETRRLMGDNFYSYGIGPNRKTLETLCLYAHEQRLAARRLSIEELFDDSMIAFQED